MGISWIFQQTLYIEQPQSLSIYMHSDSETCASCRHSLPKVRASPRFLDHLALWNSGPTPQQMVPPSRPRLQDQQRGSCSASLLASFLLDKDHYANEGHGSRAAYVGLCRAAVNDAQPQKAGFSSRPLSELTPACQPQTAGRTRASADPSGKPVSSQWLDFEYEMALLQRQWVPCLCDLVLSQHRGRNKIGMFLHGASGCVLAFRVSRGPGAILSGLWVHTHV